MMSKFKEGDRVTVPGYGGILILDYIDETLTHILNEPHWYTISESYLQGRSKTNNGEIYSEKEMSLYTN